MSSKFNMDWGNIKEPGTGGNVDYLKLKSGENVIRIADKPSLISVHWEKGVDGSNKKIVCLGAGCPICKAGARPTDRYQVKAIDRSDSTVKILEGGPAIFNAIKAYALDKDYGDPTKYDIKIKKEGSGRDTKYTVMAAPQKTDLTSEEVKAIEESKSLEEINKPKTIDEILQMGLSILAGSIGDLDDFGSEDSDILSDDDWNSL